MSVSEARLLIGESLERDVQMLVPGSLKVYQSGVSFKAESLNGAELFEAYFSSWMGLEVSRDGYTVTVEWGVQ